jgi:hypothetical protein
VNGGFIEIYRVKLTFFTVSADDFRRQKDLLTFFTVSADDFFRQKELADVFSRQC